VQQRLSSLPSLTWRGALDIVVVAFLIYPLQMIFRGRRAAHILIGVAILAMMYFVSHPC
jgi:DNA integrity scanning protein DisA with diadenylate cyclase activity